MSPGVSRRELLAAGAAAAAALGLPGIARSANAREWSDGLDFAALGDGPGWAGWASPAVANLRRGGGLGVLEAASDVFPCDPRPVAFAVDRRFRDGEVAAIVRAGGAGAGIVVRRTGPRSYYAAVFDDEQRALVLVRRDPDGVTELARTAVPLASRPMRMWLRADGPTLTATLGSAGVSAHDDTIPGPGDPGVLATARTLFPSAGPAVLPALGNLHLLPYGVQEGQAVFETAVGEQVLAAIRERSTAAFEAIAIRAYGRPRTTPASVMAATGGRPTRRGAVVRVACDLPARVEIEVSRHADFRRSRIVAAGRTNDFDAVQATIRGRPGRTLHWRPRVRREGRETVGPVRSLRVLPRARDAVTTVAVGSCAAQFGPVFDRIAERAPDVFVWQGDLNYPDTVGPLAQTVPAYAGIWRDFLANPRMEPILARTLLAVQRDDHDYGIQDANATNLLAWGLAPWEAIMERRTAYRFRAGAAEVWVLDQRRHKSDPAVPDGPDKTLLGARQRAWLLRTLAASEAPLKVICSPCTLAPVAANTRDGSWAAGFTAERDRLLDHIERSVSGRTIFVTGDTHWSMVYDRDGLFEARPCPLGIPTPNDITLTQPNAAEDARRLPGVVYADDESGHVAFLTIAGSEAELELVREDGAVAYRTGLR